MESNTLLTETRTFVGESATAVGDGYAGFRRGRQYQLRYERDGDQVRVLLDHEHCAPGLSSEMSAAQFERWLRK